MQWRQRDSTDQRVRKQQTEQQWSCIHRVGGRGSEGTKESERHESSRQSRGDHRVGGQGSKGTKESERQESSRTWWDYWPCFTWWNITE